ncbi:glycosyltransferase family 4 protein [Thiothrix sp.]|jgi:glycosyltransferase involved in cell wall biosynthesis|uniref:glycosyltransferase family 4 protein n=1 Tax=Thiothrix sp. TaxID=1032 RepID=UPI00257F6BD0|nr:glycosyltransferase family 4 protein [Thiothrix sp.]
MKSTPYKLLRITTVDLSLAKLLNGQMRFMKEHGLDVTMISAKTQFRDQVIEHEKCSHIIVPMARQISLWQDMKCLWMLVHKIRKLSPDIVHTHTSKAGLLGMIAAKIVGIPIRIQTVAGTPPDADKGGLKKYIMYATERLTFWSATHVWPNSYSLKNFIIENNFTDPKKLEVIGFGSSNGINLEKYSKHNLNKEILSDIKLKVFNHGAKKYFLFVGRLLADKGIIELIDAFLVIHTKNPESQLILLGSFENHRGKLPEKTLSAITSHSGITHVNWSEYVEYYMRLSDIVIHPSYREGFPGVLLQAGAMDTPILASDVIGNRDCVQHLETGYLFKSKDSKSIQEAMQFAIDNPAKMKQFSENWHKMVIEKFEQKKVQGFYYDKYINLLENPQ